jgi:hypothetical protein
MSRFKQTGGIGANVQALIQKRGYTEIYASVCTRIHQSKAFDFA